MSDNENRLAKILYDIFGWDQPLIEPSTILFQRTFAELGADSLDMVDIIQEMEREFKVKIPPSVHFDTPAEALAFLNAKSSHDG